MINSNLSSFQNGVNSLSSYCTSLGVTPSENTPNGIVNAISTIATNYYNNGYSQGYNTGYYNNLKTQAIEFNGGILVNSGYHTIYYTLNTPITCFIDTVVYFAIEVTAIRNVGMIILGGTEQTGTKTFRVHARTSYNGADIYIWEFSAAGYNSTSRTWFIDVSGWAGYIYFLVEDCTDGWTPHIAQNGIILEFL